MARAFTNPYRLSEEESRAFRVSRPQQAPQQGYPAPFGVPAPPVLSQDVQPLALTPAPTQTRDKRANRTGMMMALLGGLLGGNREGAAGFGAAYGQGFTRGEDARHGRNVEDWQRGQQQATLQHADKWRAQEAKNQAAVRNWQMQNQAAGTVREIEDRANNRAFRDKQANTADERYSVSRADRLGDVEYRRGRDTVADQRFDEREKLNRLGQGWQAVKDLANTAPRFTSPGQGLLRAGAEPLFKALGTPMPTGDFTYAPKPADPMAQERLKQSALRLRQLIYSQNARLKQGEAKLGMSKERLAFDRGKQGFFESLKRAEAQGLTPSQALSFSLQARNLATNPLLSPEEKDSLGATSRALQDLAQSPTGGTSTDQGDFPYTEEQVRAFMVENGMEVTPAAPKFRAAGVPGTPVLLPNRPSVSAPKPKAKPSGGGGYRSPSRPVTGTVPAVKTKPKFTPKEKPTVPPKQNRKPKPGEEIKVGGRTFRVEG